MNIQRPPQDEDDYGANSEFHANILQAVYDERGYQDEKHGDHKHTPMEWIGIIEGLVNRAKNRFSAGGPDCETMMLSEVRKIAATSFACQEQCGYVPCFPLPPKPESSKSEPSKSTLHKEIEQAINRFSAENGSNTPDFILAQYLIDCLGAYDKAVTSREKWYGREPKPLDPQPLPPPGDLTSVTQARMAGLGIGEVHPPKDKGKWPHPYEHPDVETTATDKPCRICGNAYGHALHAPAKHYRSSPLITTNPSGERCTNPPPA